MTYRSSTFGIAAFDPTRDEWGAAVQSKFLAVGALVPWVGEKGGVILTMAKTNANIGREGLKAIHSQFDAETIKRNTLQNDPDIESRQFAILDSQGNIATHTGANCLPYAGSYKGKNYVCIGNTLASDGVVASMALAFENTEGDLASKLLSALSAGQMAGGDRRGMESAALIVNGKTRKTIGEINRLIDLRVDHAINPIRELQMLLERHRIFYSTNHQDKYYPLTDHMRHILVQLLSSLHGINYTEKDFYAVVDIYNEGIQFLKPIFNKDLISGEFVHRIVEDYYNLEYLTYK